MEKICKIVYFDEESVTDYVQIVAGGELKKTLNYFYLIYYTKISLAY